MRKKFDKIYEDSLKEENIIPLDLKKDCFVIFSDHHKGDGSAADDFQKNVFLYEAALSYYKEKGFKLIVLGDNEELWENRYDQILSMYRDLIMKEIDMALEVGNKENKKRKIRIWGNHDKEIFLNRFKKFYKKIDETLLDNVHHKKGLCLSEDIFLIHGHQGRFFDDIAWRVSRWAVQFIWKKIQKIFHIGNDGPAENFKIRDDLELAYYQWAKGKKLMLICGHTHRAIFGSLTHLDHLQIEINHLEKNLRKIPSGEEKEKMKKEIEHKKVKIKKILEKRKGQLPKSFERKPEWPVPCYFNDGCCCYTNGITCLEIEKGTIRLAKWHRQNRERIVFSEGNVSQILNYIKESRPIDEAFEPKVANFSLT